MYGYHEMRRFSLPSPSNHTLQVIWAAAASLICAVIIAVFAFEMPFDMTAASGKDCAACILLVFGSARHVLILRELFLKKLSRAVLHGILFSVLPISWIVLTALFLYDLTVRSHAFDIVKAVLLSLSPDRRMQTLVIAYLFGGFLEGAAGFSTPVALAAAMLAGMGFSKIESASLALLSNTIPVSYGALGTPILVIPEATGFDIDDVARATGRLQVPFSLLVPWMVVFASCGSIQGTLETWPALLTVSLVYTGSLAIMTEFVGARPVSVVASLVSLVAVAVLLQFWQPPTVLRAKDRSWAAGGQVGAPSATRGAPGRKQGGEGAPRQR